MAKMVLAAVASFSTRTSPSLCAKCQKLSLLAESSDEYITWKNMKQCSGCGLAWKHLSGTLCGRCASASDVASKAQTILMTTLPASTQSTAHLAKIAIDTSQQSRAHTMDARLNKELSGIAAAKANHCDAEQTIMVSVGCRIKGRKSKHENAVIDSGTGTWARDDYLSEILVHALSTLNTDWGKNHGLDLAIDKVELRMAGNCKIIDGPVPGTVGEVYDHHITGDLAAFYNHEKSKKKKAGGMKVPPHMEMEVYVDKEKLFLKYLKQLQSATSSSNSSGLKCHAHAGGDSLLCFVLFLFLAKINFTTVDGLPLQLSFLRSTLPFTGSIQSSTFVKISLQRAEAFCDAATGQVQIAWLSDAAFEDGLLNTSIFAEGTTKKVHQLSIGTTLFVAKQFYDVGSVGPIVTANENEVGLSNDLIRLKSASWFLDKFKSYSKDKGVEIAKDIIVSEGFLIREDGPVSTASGLPPPSNNVAVWLVEPRRTTAVFKYSGTLIGMTLHAFCHFVFDFSNHKLVLADLQGSPMTVQGKETIVLFDIMTHSPTSDSGVGDFGLEGINKFIDQHKCNLVCAGLKLSQIKNLVNDDNEESVSDKDETNGSDTADK
ncbi:kinase-like domain-containing protein [Crepidotus variabilis]|uniref:Kinase-like domain-containing protein n=1 Tax=Crepidotus variabilis TaxID=179855 RepID=A0A9P6E6Q5_9AGAR|nr:kinase-like domain-containing protein [Crepidotus variabilis]